MTNNDFMKQFIPPAHRDAELIFRAEWRESIGPDDATISEIKKFQDAAKSGEPVLCAGRKWIVTEIDVVDDGSTVIVRGHPI